MCVCVSVCVALTGTNAELSSFIAILGNYEALLNITNNIGILLHDYKSCHLFMLIMFYGLFSSKKT